MVGDVCGLNLFRCVYAYLRSVGEVSFSVISQCLTFYVSHFGVSAWCLKCTKHMCCNSDVVQ